jgi:hypothetical protein
LNEQTTVTPVTPAAEAVPDFDTAADLSSYRAMREGKTVATEVAKPAASDDHVTAETKTESEADSGPAGDESEDEHESGAEPARKKGGFQKRIDKLTQKNAELERQLAEARGGANAAKPGEQAQAQADATAKPQARDFATYEEFVEKLAEWTADQREAARTRKAAEEQAARDRAQAAKQWTDRLNDARTRYNDFDAVALSDAPISQTVHNVIVGSEQGPDLAYYLGQHPEEREAINKLNPVQTAIALGKIAAKLEAQTTDTTETKVSKAPPPIKPLNARATTQRPNPESMTNDEYRRWREGR